MRTTAQIRELWSPACRARDVSLVPAYQALDAVMEKHKYRPRSGVTGAFNCRRITGGSGYSLHAYDPGETFAFWTGVKVTTAIAVDINWDKNPYGKRLVTDMPRAMVDEILSIETVDGVQVWKWGGYYSSNKDAMHYEIQASPAELLRGVIGGAEEDFLAKLTEEEQQRILVQSDLSYKALFDERGGKKVNVIDELRKLVADILAEVKKP